MKTQHGSNFWMITLPRPDLERCIEIGIFGMNRSGVIKNVLLGDKVVCCATKEWTIVGLGEATSDYYIDDRVVFLKNGSFIDRFNFKMIPIIKEIAFKPLIPEMHFIKQAQYWPVYFKTGITKITESDWNNICKGAKGLAL